MKKEVLHKALHFNGVVLNSTIQEIQPKQNLVSHQHQLDIKNLLETIFRGRTDFLMNIKSKFDKRGIPNLSHDDSLILAHFLDYLESTQDQLLELVQVLPDGGSDPLLAGRIYEETILVGELRSLVNHISFQAQ